MPDKRHLLTLLLLLLAGPCRAAAADGAPLRGVDTVAIHIQGLERDLETYGVTETSLKTALEQRLAAAGIKVVKPGETERVPGSAVLTLRLTLNRTVFYFFLYNLHMAVQSRLPLARDPRAYTSITTWSDTKIGMLMPRELGKIRDLSLQQTDEFLKVYRQQNPR